MDISKRRGRPRVGMGKEMHISLRLSAQDANKLAYLVEKRGETKSDIFIKAMRAQYNLEIFRSD